MGRPTRFRLPGIPQLITQRGHNRLPCFLDGADYNEFKSMLSDSADAAGCSLQALLMLPNAYWVLARPTDADGIARMIQRTGRCYVRYCNEKYRREGTLWASRYRACLIEPTADRLGHCLGFLRQTPTRTGVVAAGTAWPWFFEFEESSEAGAMEDDTTADEIASLLEKGLVFGSEGFRTRIAREEGIRTEPGLRGRPRKRVGA